MLISDEELKNIIYEIDSKGNKKINYSEFMAATIRVNEHLTENKVTALFN